MFSEGYLVFITWSKNRRWKRLSSVGKERAKGLQFGNKKCEIITKLFEIKKSSKTD